MTQFSQEAGLSADTAYELVWSDAMVLGHAPIDAAHEAFVEVVTALGRCTPESMLACLAALDTHLVSHFEIEREWMERTGFPAAGCHLDEHQRVLDTVQRVYSRALAGTIESPAVKRLAEALVDWFPGHATYMDSALSTWINKKVYGGAPVVLRRHAVPSEGRADATA